MRKGPRKLEQDNTGQAEEASHVARAGEPLDADARSQVR